MDANSILLFPLFLVLIKVRLFAQHRSGHLHGVPGMDSAGEYQANEQAGVTGSAGEYQADEQAGVERLDWGVTSR